MPGAAVLSTTGQPIASAAWSALSRSPTSTHRTVETPYAASSSIASASPRGPLLTRARQCSDRLASTSGGGLSVRRRILKSRRASRCPIARTAVSVPSRIGMPAPVLRPPRVHKRRWTLGEATDSEITTREQMPDRANSRLRTLEDRDARVAKVARLVLINGRAKVAEYREWLGGRCRRLQCDRRVHIFAFTGN